MVFVSSATLAWSSKAVLTIQESAIRPVAEALEGGGRERTHLLQLNCSLLTVIEVMICCSLRPGIAASGCVCVFLCFRRNKTLRPQRREFLSSTQNLSFSSWFFLSDGREHDGGSGRSPSISASSARPELLEAACRI